MTLGLFLLLGRMCDEGIAEAAVMHGFIGVVENEASLAHCTATTVAATIAHDGKLSEFPMRDVKSANAAYSPNLTAIIVASLVVLLSALFGMYSLLTGNGEEETAVEIDDDEVEGAMDML